MGNRYYYGIVHQNSSVGEPNTQGLKVYFPMLIDNKLWPWYNPILSLLYFQGKEFFSTVVMNNTKVRVNHFRNLKDKNVTRNVRTFLVRQENSNLTFGLWFYDIWLLQIWIQRRIVSNSFIYHLFWLRIFLETKTSFPLLKKMSQKHSFPSFFILSFYTRIDSLNLFSCW